MGSHHLVTASRAWWWGRYARVYDWLWGGPLTDRLGDEIARRVGRCPGPVLDAGTGTGLVATRLRRLVGPVVGMDASAPMLARARRHPGPWVRADLTRPPFAPGTFDAVVAANVLHLCGTPERALDALVALVGRGGRLVVCWPHERTGPMAVYRAERRHGTRPVRAALRLATRIGVGLLAVMAGGPARTGPERLFSAVGHTVATGTVHHTHETVLDGLTHLVVFTRTASLTDRSTRK